MKNKKIIVPLVSLVAVILISSGVLLIMNQRTENYKNMPLIILMKLLYTNQKEMATAGFYTF